MWANRIPTGMIRPSIFFGISRDCSNNNPSMSRFKRIKNNFPGQPKKNVTITVHQNFRTKFHPCLSFTMAIRNHSTMTLDPPSISPDTSESTSSTTLHSFKSLSPHDKKIVAKNLGLKASFLNDLENLFITGDLQSYVFNYYLAKNSEDIKIYPMYYRIDPDSGKIQETKITSLNEENSNDGSEFMFCRVDKTEPCTFDSIYDEKEKIVIFNNWIDALIFHQQTKLPTIVMKWVEERMPTDALKDFLIKLRKRFREIYLWPSNDGFLEAYRTLSRDVLTRVEDFDLTKIFIVNSDISPFQMVTNNSKEKFDVIWNNAAPILPRSVSNFIGLKNEVDFEFSDDPSLNGVQWSRFEKLNEHLKGFRNGEMTIVTGPTGCGKTTFVSEYSLDLCMQGVPTLWGSFEIKNARLIKMMLTQFAKKKMFLGEADYEIESERFTRLPLYFMKFQGQTEVDLVLEAAQQTVHSLGIKHIVIDNLQFMLGLNVDSPYERFAKQDFLISAFREFSTKNDCHITLVAHPRKEKEDVGLSNNSLYGGIRLSQDADNVFILMNRFNAKYRCNKYVQITKNRFNGSLGVIPLYFDKETLCFSKAPLNRTNTTSASSPMINEDRDTVTSTTDNHVSDIDRIRYLFESQ